MGVNTLNVFIIGIGGYGNKYLDELLKHGNEQSIKITGCADPSPINCTRLDDIKQQGIPLEPSLQALYERGLKADLVVMSPPIQLHAPLTGLALQHGSAVLCEKPLCATLEEAEAMLAAQQQTGLPVAIGYQWSFADATQRLKKDILSGIFGAAKRAKCLVLWPRSKAYYSRNNWAGKIRAEDGALIYDSPVNNATAHFLHHMLYLLGDDTDRAAQPGTINAQCFRANPIENFDAAALQVKAAGAEILFYTAHCVPDLLNPIMEIEFEKGRVSFDYSDPTGFKAIMNDGTERIYGHPDSTYWNKLWQTVDAVRKGTPVLCGIPAATPHTTVVDYLQNNIEVVSRAEKIKEKTWDDGATLKFIPGFAEALREAYENNTLPAFR